MLVPDLGKITQMIETVCEPLLVVALQEVRILYEVHRAACEFAPAIFEQLPHACMTVTRNLPKKALESLKAEKKMVVRLFYFANFFDLCVNEPFVLAPTKRTKISLAQFDESTEQLIF